MKMCKIGNSVVVTVSEKILYFTKKEIKLNVLDLPFKDGNKIARRLFTSIEILAFKADDLESLFIASKGYSALIKKKAALLQDEQFVEQAKKILGIAK